MQYTITVFIFLTSLSLSGCTQMKTESIEYFSTLGEAVTTVFPEQDTYPTKFSIEIFPIEIYLGDAIYLVIDHENISQEVVNVFDHQQCFAMYEYYPKKFTLSSNIIREEYYWIPEHPSSVLGSRHLPERNLQPGEKYSYQKNYLEFPPLEDWNDPFWKELCEKMPPEGITCKLHIKHGYNDPYLHLIRPQMEVEQDILIKPRPKNETALLEKWYKNTPKKLFPKADQFNRKVPNFEDYDLRSSGRSDIKIGGNRYDPWMFIRLGNRKPSDPNNPTTLAGWRELEASLTPSTMRDEVRLTRLQLEYYSAKPGEASENAKKELLEWLQSLPEVQRTIYLTFLVSKMDEFARSRANYEKPTPLNAKNRELMLAIYDILDCGCQEQVCNRMSIYYNDRSLTPPPGVKIIRPVMEILTPTAEDLAHGTKELPDDFRIWDVIGATGPAKMVGKFVEFKEDEDTVILKHRENWNINLDFSALSEEDKKYAREQSQRNAAE